jgi:tRNA nucleotidyltransferase (CCA-adding enzyme)
MDVIKRVPKTFELRWAALMHDFGKPATKELKEGTVDHYHYHGHQDVSAEIAEQLADILKFSNEQKELVVKFIKYHDADLATCRNGTFKRTLADIGIEHFLDFMKLKLADAEAHQLRKDTKWAIEVPDKVYARFAKVVEESQALTVRDLDINGYDLIDMGFQGKQIGDCLNYLVEEVLEDASVNKNEILKEKALLFKEKML